MTRLLARFLVASLFAALLLIGSTPSVGATTYGEDCLTLTGVQAYPADSRTGYNLVESFVNGPHTVYLHYTLIRSDQPNNGLCHQYDSYIYLTEDNGFGLYLEGDYANLSLYMTLRTWLHNGSAWYTATATCGAEQQCHLIQNVYPQWDNPSGDNWETSYYNANYYPTSNYYWLHGI